MTNWESPRGQGVVTIERCAPHVRTWNPAVTLVWTGDLVTQITEVADDGTTIRIDLSWTGDELDSITKWVTVP